MNAATTKPRAGRYITGHCAVTARHHVCKAPQCQCDCHRSCPTCGQPIPPTEARP